MTTKEEYVQRFAQQAARGSPAVLQATTWRFEHERCLFLLRTFRLAPFHKQEMAQLHARHAGDRLLTFAAFNEHFPTFPFLLGAHTLQGLEVPWGDKLTSSHYTVHEDPYSTEPSRFRKFGWVPFVVAYTRFYAQHAATVNRRLCLVFKRKGIVNGMCVHNDDSERYWPAGLAWVYKFSESGQDRRLYVLPFDNLVGAVYAGGRGWRP